MPDPDAAFLVVSFCGLYRTSYAVRSAFLATAALLIPYYNNWHPRDEQGSGQHGAMANVTHLNLHCSENFVVKKARETVIERERNDL